MKIQRGKDNVDFFIYVYFIYIFFIYVFSIYAYFIYVYFVYTYLLNCFHYFIKREDKRRNIGKRGG